MLYISNGYTTSPTIVSIASCVFDLNRFFADYILLSTGRVVARVSSLVVVAGVSSLGVVARVFCVPIIVVTRTGSAIELLPPRTLLVTDTLAVLAVQFVIR